MSNLDRWIEQCELAANGKLGQHQVRELSDSIYGAFGQKSGYEHIGTFASDKQWRQAHGALLQYHDDLEHESRMAAASASKVSASATATASVDLSMSIKLIQSLPESTLSEDDKGVLVGMLSILQTMEGEQKKSKLMEVVKWLGDKAVDVALVAIPALASMI